MTRLTLALFAALAIATPRHAHAIAACYSNRGVSPAPASKLPRHPRIAFYDDARGGDAPTYTATIAGKPVELKLTTIDARPYRLDVLEVDSERTGALVITRNGSSEREVRYQIVKDVALAKELPVEVGRTQRTMRHSTVREEFDALAIRLPAGTPAITAHVKIRRDDKAAWGELDVPVAPNDLDDPRPVIRLGELGCTRNYSVDLLRAGVDLEVTVTLVDGSTRPVKGLAAHVALP